MIFKTASFADEIENHMEEHQAEAYVEFQVTDKREEALSLLAEAKTHFELAGLQKNAEVVSAIIAKLAMKCKCTEDGGECKCPASCDKCDCNKEDENEVWED